MLVFITDPEIASVVQIPVVAPEKEDWLVLVVGCGVIPVFYSRAVVEWDTVETVCWLRLCQSKNQRQKQQ